MVALLSYEAESISFTLGGIFLFLTIFAEMIVFYLPFMFYYPASP
jgi:hypothetical protein